MTVMARTTKKTNDESKRLPSRLGWHLRRLMQDPRIGTQERLAEVCRVSQGTVSNWIVARYDVPWRPMVLLSDYLELDEQGRRDLAMHYLYGQEPVFAEDPNKGRLPGGARSEQDLDEVLDYESERRARRAAEEGENGRSSGDRRA